MVFEITSGMQNKSKQKTPNNFTLKWNHILPAIHRKYDLEKISIIMKLFFHFTDLLFFKFFIRT